MIIATDRGNLKVSTLTGKLEGFRAINTNTLSNPFCTDMRKKDTICSQCYSAAMLEGSRKNCVKPWQTNSDILAEPLTVIPYFMDRVIRYHAHGELINRQHYLNFVAIANHNPQTTFALWTKRKDLIRGVDKPANLILIFSNPRTDKVLKRVPIGFDRVFNAIDKEHVKPTDNVNCHAKCKDCMICYTMNDEKIIIELTKKRN